MAKKMKRWLLILLLAGTLVFLGIIVSCEQNCIPCIIRAGIFGEGTFGASTFGP